MQPCSWVLERHLIFIREPRSRHPVGCGSAGWNGSSVCCRNRGGLGDAISYTAPSSFFWWQWNYSDSVSSNRSQREYPARADRNHYVRNCGLHTSRRTRTGSRLCETGNGLDGSSRTRWRRVRRICCFAARRRTFVRGTSVGNRLVWSSQIGNHRSLGSSGTAHVDTRREIPSRLQRRALQLSEDRGGTE